MLPSLTRSFSALPPAAQASVLSLHDFRYPSEDASTPPQSHLLTIFRSNAYNTGDDRIGLFAQTARINHDCTPNAGTWWSERTERRVVYALRNIAAGEEITVSYIPLLKPRAERQARLAQYGFQCGCDACSDSVYSADGDKRRIGIRDLILDLESKVSRRCTKAGVCKKHVEKARKLVRMIEDEGLGDYLAKAYHLAAAFAEQADEVNEARLWGEQELEVLRWMDEDSEEVLKSVKFLVGLKDR
jgi:hypothetical protein